MNVPKYIWNEAVLTAAYLINRMPSRILGMKSLAKLLLGQREFKVPPRYLVVFTLSGTIDLQLESWILRL
jgi:hypothetical protein